MTRSALGCRVAVSNFQGSRGIKDQAGRVAGN